MSINDWAIVWLACGVVVFVYSVCTLTVAEASEYRTLRRDKPFLSAFALVFAVAFFVALWPIGVLDAMAKHKVRKGSKP